MPSYRENLLNFKDQLSFGKIESFRPKKLSKARPDGIVIFGMGGSGVPGMILEKLAGELRIPVPVVSARDRCLPKTNFKKPLFIAVSFSGETAETIGAFKSALSTKNKAGVAVVAGGGKLKMLAERYKLPLALIKNDLTPRINLHGGLTPREASGIMFYGIVKILKAVFPLKISPLKGLRPLGLKSVGIRLARAAKNQNVLIYTDNSFAHLGYIWKTNLNETAKIPAFTNTYPELSHNEIAGFEKAKGAWIIFWLKGKLSAADHKKIKIINKILAKKKVKNVEIPLTGKNQEEKTWNGVMLSHWVSLHLAELNKVNPRETKVINKLKNQFK